MADATPNAQGLIPMATYPDCTERYDGAFTGASVFVAGLGTEQEQIFVRGQRVEAMRYANSNKITLDQVHSTSLCGEAVKKVLGA